MGEFEDNLWAPWRMEYLRTLGQPSDEGDCFLCRYAAAPELDEQNHVLWRSPQTMVLLNRFPYTNGHLLIAPLLHRSGLEELPEEVLCELTVRIRDALAVLRRVVEAQGFNVGMNVGRCAGAGLPDHVHWHIVPRWAGDTNFVGVVGGVRIIPQELQETGREFRQAARELGLPA
jgi:ATP adenylyltransferase